MKKTTKKQTGSTPLIGTAVVIKSDLWLEVQNRIGNKKKYSGEIGVNAFLGVPSAKTLKRAGYDGKDFKLVPVDYKTLSVLKVRHKINKSFGLPDFLNAAPVEVFNTNNMIHFATDRQLEGDLFD